MSERYSRRRQNSQDPVPSTSRGIIHKHSKSQRNPNARSAVNDSREAFKLVDSDSSDIENEDFNVPKYSKSKSSSKKHNGKFSSRGRKLTDDFDSEDEDDTPIKNKKKLRVVIESDSDDDDSDIQVKRKKGLRHKKPIVESEESESEEDIIPKFRSKKCRLMSFSDDNSELPPDRSSSIVNGNSSRSGSRQLFEEDSISPAARRDNARVCRKYFLDDEDCSSGSESEWDTNWENEWEEHWQNPQSNPNQSNGSPNLQEVSSGESEKQLKNEPVGSNGKEEKSVVAENSGSNDDSSKDSCPICLLDFTDQKLGTPASCDHVFCLECLLEWCKVVNTCPADRKEFLSIHVRKHLGGDIVETVPVQDRTQNAQRNGDDSTSCEVCGRTDGEDTMLLCDNCDLGYHMDCLNPPLTEVPAEEWICPDCTVGVFPGIGVNFLTLFSVFNEILGERGVLHGLSSPFADDLFVGPNFFERDGGDVATLYEHGHRRESRTTRSPVGEDSRRRRRHTSIHRDAGERQTRSSTRGPSNAADSAPSTSGARPRQRRSSNSSNPSRSARPLPTSIRNRRPSSRGPSSSGDGPPRRSPAQGIQLSPRDRGYNARSLRRYTHTNFRGTRPRRSFSDNMPIRLIRRRWVDTSSSDE